jgi:hypothetical protein
VVVKQWAWDGVNGNNAVWAGSSAAGIRLFPKGPEDEWQAAVPFDSAATPPLPVVWSNGGAGGITLYKNGSVTLFTGPLQLPHTGDRAGAGAGVGAGAAPIVLQFSVLVTPTRPVDLKKHYSERYAQLGGPANYSFIASQGASVVNMHQGNAINPWINYPYETNVLMKAAADACHALGLKFKIYNTMRELSNRCREVFAMRSLNETYVVGTSPATVVGSGADWIQEHLSTSYEVAWSNPVVNQYPGQAGGNAPLPPLTSWVDHPHEQDAAIKVKALSRWNNYYVEGIRQMIDDFGYDGIYLDEIAYDRVTIQRAKKQLGAERLIDHHSDKGGFTPSPAANYLELYPFIDSLWYGEGFDYETASPSYWLLEMSGLPHGLAADLLRYSGMVPAHFKGMLVGSANRWQSAAASIPPSSADPFDPRSVWKLWDSFRIEQAVMHGWWLDKERGNGTVPVSSSHPMVKVTSYVKKGEGTLLAVASFAPAATNLTVTLTVDWDALGLPSNTLMVAPVLVPFQPTANTFHAGSSILVEGGQGWLLLLGK